MKLILMRHGIALDREEAEAASISDLERPLTEKGRKKVRQVTQQLMGFEKDIKAIVTSPLLRAKQTAEIVSDLMGIDVKYHSNELHPAGSPMAFSNWLKKEVTKESCVLSVGHEPQLSVFASWCLSGQLESFIELKKSGVICLEFESFQEVGPSKSILKYVLNPKSLGF